jgi:hypothetical protein
MNKDWKHIEERFQKRLSCWRSKMSSIGGRLVLINSVLSSLSMFMMSFLKYLEGFEEVGLFYITVFLAE